MNMELTKIKIGDINQSFKATTDAEKISVASKMNYGSAAKDSSIEVSQNQAAKEATTEIDLNLLREREASLANSTKFGTTLPETPSLQIPQNDPNKDTWCNCPNCEQA